MKHVTHSVTERHTAAPTVTILFFASCPCVVLVNRTGFAEGEFVQGMDQGWSIRHGVVLASYQNTRARLALTRDVTVSTSIADGVSAGNDVHKCGVRKGWIGQGQTGWP